MKKLFIALALFCVAVSCERPFDFQSESGACLYMQAVVDNGYLVVSPHYAVPVNGGEAPSGSIRMDMQVNGFSQPMETLLMAGDEVTVHLEADGVPGASGSTRVPSAPLVIDWTQERVQVDTIDATRISFMLDHAPQEGEYFGIQILMETSVLYMDGSMLEQNSWLTPGYILSAAESGKFDLADFMQVNFDGSTLGGKEFRPLTLVTRKQFEGEVYSFYLNSFDTGMLDRLRDGMSGGETGVAGGGIASGEIGNGQGKEDPDPGRIPIGLETAYHFYFASLSSEFYQYAKTLYQSNFDFLSNMGFTPANFTWSNVEGGLGFVGAISGVWIGPLEINIK